MNTAASQRPRVALFVSCLVNVFRPSVAEAAVTLLERAGCEVEVPLEQSCCGQPGYNAGAIAAARPIAQNLIRCFEGYDYVVAPTGSCAGMIKAHYPRLFADMPAWRERAQALAARTHELTHFLHSVMAYAPATVTGVPPVSYHDSCAGNPECAEITFFCASVAVCIHATFFVCIFGNRPNIFAPSKLSLNLFQDFFPAGP